MKTREKTIIGKIPFENVSFQEAVNTTLLTTNENEQASAIRLSNSYCVSLAEQDEKYASLFQDEGYNFADGKPITWAMRLLTQKSASQIRGADFFRAVVDAGRSRDIKHAFIGGNQDVLEKLERTLTNAYPGIKIVSLWDRDTSIRTRVFMIKQLVSSEIYKLTLFGWVWALQSRTL